MGQNDGGETAWSYGKRSDVYYQSVPCRNRIIVYVFDFMVFIVFILS